MSICEHFWTTAKISEHENYYKEAWLPELPEVLAMMIVYVIVKWKI